MSDFATLRLTREEGLARLTLDRPERNGMTNRMVREAFEALTEVARDPSIRVLVLTGAGRSFCPGADMQVQTGDAGDPEDSAPIDPLCFQVPVLLHEMPAVTVAAVNGACAGAGFGWACGCDLRVATRRAMFNTAFLNVAFAGDMGLPWSLPRLVGAAKARELSLICEKFDAQTALTMGLVARVYDDDTFAASVEALLEELLDRSPVALRTLKAHYLAGERMSFGDFVSLETEHHLKIGRMDDTREAFRAFLDKRKPVFTGR